MHLKQVLAVSIAAIMIAPAQTKPAASPSARKAAGSSSQVDDVIQLLKGGMSEAMIVKTLQRQNKPVVLSTADMLKLQKAGASENIINAMTEPSSAAAGAGPAATLTATASAGANSCPTVAPVAALDKSLKRRIALDPFDYSAVHTDVTTVFGNDVQIGRGIRSMLTVKMAQSNKVVLVEREKIKNLEAEQDYGATNRVKKGTQAKIGQITGADAMLYGEIVTFGFDNKTKSAGAGAAGWIPGRLGVIAGAASKAKRTDKAIVAINLRIVDAETSETLDAEEARGESSRTSTDWKAMAGSWHGTGNAESSMTSSDFTSTIIGEATQNAVNQIAQILESKVAAIGAKTRTIEGRVATIDGCTLYLSVGGNDGVHIGDHFEIHQIVKEVIDPATKEVIDQQTVKVGDFYASTVRDKSTIGTYGGQPLSADKVLKPGYAARFTNSPGT